MKLVVGGAKAKRTLSPLRHVLELIERGGSTVLRATELAKIIDEPTRRALVAAGVIGTAPAAVYWDCGGERRGCRREIRANYDGAKKALVAVCDRAPAECPAVELGFDDVAQLAVTAEALPKAVAELLGIEMEKGALAKIKEAETRAIADAPEPVRLGVVAGTEIYWAGRPRGQRLGEWCPAREKVRGAGALVVVPTRKHVSAALAARFGVGERVEICAVEDLVEVRGGALAIKEGVEFGRAREDVSAGASAGATIAAGAAIRVEPRDRRRTASASVGIAALLDVTRWNQLCIGVVNESTVRIEADGRVLTRTFVELGFVDRRKSKQLRPTKAWSVFIALCQKGRFRPSEYGAFGEAFSVKKAIEDVRANLRVAFGIEASPFRSYTKSEGWRPAFAVR